jgi:predicted ATPase
MGQWRYSLTTDKLTATMQIAMRVYSLVQELNDSALMIGGQLALAVTLYFLGDFETARQYARRGAQIWHSGKIESPVGDLHSPAVGCLFFEALPDWHFGEIASCHIAIAEAISLAKELNDMNALGLALWHAAVLAAYEHDPAEVERLASDLMELSTRQNFVRWLPRGAVLRGWARSASGQTAEGISLIEDGIGDYRATGAMLDMPLLLALKAESWHLVNRTPEALQAIAEAEALVERFENRYWSAELHRLRGVFLAALGANETEIEASFCEAIRIAKEQKSVSLAKRAEASYAEYRDRKGDR